MPSLDSRLAKRRTRARFKTGRTTVGPAASATSRVYPLSGKKGARIRVNVPARFWGTWKFTVTAPGEPARRFSARVFCGDDHRLKFVWSANPGSSAMRTLAAAANKTVAELGGRCK